LSFHIKSIQNISRQSKLVKCCEINKEILLHAARKRKLLYCILDPTIYAFYIFCFFVFLSFNFKVNITHMGNLDLSYDVQSAKEMLLHATGAISNVTGNLTSAASTFAGMKNEHKANKKR
jgi:hypothetical protein